VSIDQFEFVRLRQLCEHIARQGLEPCTVHDREPPERHALPGTELDLRLHRFEQVQILQLLAECLGALEFALILPQEFEHIPHIGSRLAIIAKQSLAAAALIKPRQCKA
jgi:hypothetical protein